MDTLSQAFKALGHPHRLAIVKRLIDRAIACDATDPSRCTFDPACCGFGEIVEELGVSKATVSHHLKELARAGLIERIRKGRRVYCRVREARLAELRDFLSGTSAVRRTAATQP